jgi:hypothetical protein
MFYRHCQIPRLCPPDLRVSFVNAPLGGGSWSFREPAQSPPEISRGLLQGQVVDYRITDQVLEAQRTEES